MKHQGKQNPDPRQKLLDDLTNLIIGFNSINDITIIMIDVNEGLYTTNSKMALFLATTQMTTSSSNTRKRITMYRLYFWINQY
jgi:hypothetical protein